MDPTPEQSDIATPSDLAPESERGYRAAAIVLLTFLALALMVAAGAWWYVAGRPLPAEQRTAGAVAPRTPSGAPVSGLTPERRALAAATALEAAVQRGVDYGEYSQLLDSAEATLAAFRPSTAPQSRVRDLVKRALVYYGAAAVAWDLDLTSQWWRGQDTPTYWTHTYPDLVLEAPVTPDSVRQSAWGVAGKALADARHAAGP